MVKYTSVVKGEVKTVELDKEHFIHLMECLNRRAKKIKLEKKKNEMFKKWNGGV